MKLQFAKEQLLSNPAEDWNDVSTFEEDDAALGISCGIMEGIVVDSIPGTVGPGRVKAKVGLDTGTSSLQSEVTVAEATDERVLLKLLFCPEDKLRL